MADRRGFVDIVANFDELPDTDSFEIEDGTERLDRLSCDNGASGSSFGQGTFVFIDESLQESILRGDSVEGGNVDFAQALDENRSSIL